MSLNLCDILKDCPKGTKLYCTIFGDVELEQIDWDCKHPIMVRICKSKILELFTQDGRLYDEYDGECTVFPSKDQRDWSKFTAPWYKKEKLVELKESKDKKIREAILNGLIDCRDAPDLGWSNFGGIHIDDCIAWLENQGEQNLSSANEHIWLYLVSDVLTWKDGIGQYLDDQRVQEFAKRLCSKYVQKLYNTSNTGKDEQKFADKAEPKFKVGDRVRHKEQNKDDVYEISKVYDDSYGIAGFNWMIYMKYQDQYELVPNKFDPRTLQPFDKVLVRYNDSNYWGCQFFSYIAKDEARYPYECVFGSYNQCIPYNDETNHLVGTSDEVPEFYRYWED